MTSYLFDRELVLIISYEWMIFEVILQSGYGIHNKLLMIQNDKNSICIIVLK